MIKQQGHPKDQIQPTYVVGEYGRKLIRGQDHRVSKRPERKKKRRKRKEYHKRRKNNAHALE